MCKFIFVYMGLTVLFMAAFLQAHAAELRAKGIRYVSLIVPNPPKWPRVNAFTSAKDFAEDPQRRNMYPTM